ncbi:hypothetical protein NDU88_009961 [Pleurodeles waltl]|uniref:Secreted protein n=1 Tax=Pleurodeles waltl TaxID=8319 RepID=A0AAV7PTY6_PLEWA|nr:hypothetical protein NDU88_009961 [Pleurodeles waltl]
MRPGLLCCLSSVAHRSCTFSQSRAAPAPPLALQATCCKGCRTPEGCGRRKRTTSSARAAVAEQLLQPRPKPSHLTWVASLPRLSRGGEHATTAAATHAQPAAPGGPDDPRLPQEGRGALPPGEAAGPSPHTGP